MTTSRNSYRVIGGQFGANVVVSGGNLSEGSVDIDLRYSGSDPKDALAGIAYLLADLPKDSALQIRNSRLCIEDERLVLLELGGEIAFCSHHRLLADIV